MSSCEDALLHVCHLFWVSLGCIILFLGKLSWKTLDLQAKPFSTPCKLSDRLCLSVLLNSSPEALGSCSFWSHLHDFCLQINSTL